MRRERQRRKTRTTSCTETFSNFDFLTLGRTPGISLGLRGANGAALAGGFKKHDCSGGGNVERRHLAGHGNAEQVVAGAADQIVEAGAFASENDYGVGREVVAVVILCAVLVEADDPEVVGLEDFEGANEVDDAGEAEVLSSSGGGLDGNGREGSGASLGEEDAIDSRGFGGAEKGAEVLRIFDAVERKDQARVGSGEKVLDAEEVALADDGDNSLVGGGSGEAGEGVAGLNAGFDTGGAAKGDDGGETRIVAALEAFLGEANVVEAAGAGAKSLLDGMEAVQDFHQVPVYQVAQRGKSI